MNETRHRVQDAEEIARIKDVVRQNPLPDFVDGFELRLGYDNADEPAVWVVFHTHGDFPGAQAEADRWIAEMNELANTVREQVIGSGVQRFPYFRFEPMAFADKPDACRHGDDRQDCSRLRTRDYVPGLPDLSGARSEKCH